MILMSTRTRIEEWKAGANWQYENKVVVISTRQRSGLRSRSRSKNCCCGRLSWRYGCDGPSAASATRGGDTVGAAPRLTRSDERHRCDQGGSLTSADRMRLAGQAQRRLRIQPPAPHLLLVRERREEERRRRLPGGAHIGHVRWRGRERADRLRVREQLRVRYRR